MQEGPANVLKHVRNPTGVRVLLSAHQDTVRVAVRNDGTGHGRRGRRFARSGFGLLGLSERVEGLRGELYWGRSPRAVGSCRRPCPGADRVAIRVLVADDQEMVRSGFCLILEALRAGAAGFVLKNSGPRFLIDAVRAAVDGGALISPSVTVRLLERFAHAAPSSESGGPAPAREDGRGGQTAEALTSREREVAAKVARGRTNVEIATELAFTIGTVKSHLTHVQDKLQARNRVEIAAWPGSAASSTEPQNGR
ncbi:hypothetical protein GCM10023191_067500 [Actinoallomurus oryzae]|uniref:HTH luxR-type domain-containing protein n=1 Tax=Actinoallomurus oryzae TaxID=502180 RepID=A0ABP8QRL0_9ACTN